MLRTLALGSALLLFTSTSITGLHAASKDVSKLINQVSRRQSGHFTDVPRKPFLGNKKRDPKTRGGLWSSQNLADLRNGHDAPLFLSEEATQGGGHTTSVSPEPGGPLPWEGSFGGASATGGAVNTGSGNKLVAIPLVSWKVRGGMTLDFTLFHNSQTNYTDELGYGWSWTYDIYINVSGDTATVHWGDGGCIPFTEVSGGGGSSTTGAGSGSTTASPQEFASESNDVVSTPGGSLATTSYTAPAGIFDSLVKNNDNTWTLTKKDGRVYSFNDDGFCTSVADRNGNTITITLNGQNYATAITDPTGRQITISLDGSNNFTGIEDELGRDCLSPSTAATISPPSPIPL